MLEIHRFHDSPMYQSNGALAAVQAGVQINISSASPFPESPAADVVEPQRSMSLRTCQ